MFTLGLFPSLPLPNPHSFLLVFKNETEQNKIPILLVVNQTILGEKRFHPHQRQHVVFSPPDKQRNPISPGSMLSDGTFVHRASQSHSASGMSPLWFHVEKKISLLLDTTAE